jgi:hypothetical protein
MCCVWINKLLYHKRIIIITILNFHLWCHQHDGFLRYLFIIYQVIRCQMARQGKINSKCVEADVSTENLFQETGKSWKEMFKKTDFQLRNLMGSQYQLHHNLRIHQSDVASDKNDDISGHWNLTWHSWKSNIQTNQMTQSPSLKANNYSGSPEISRILWNLKARYRVHGQPPLVLIPSQMNPFYTNPSHFFNPLQTSGHYMYHQFNIQQLYALPTLYLCVLCGSENKQWLVPLAA